MRVGFVRSLLRKSSRPGFVIAVVSVAAVVLSSSGGLIGILLGFRASFGLKNILQVPFVFNAGIAIIVFIFSAAVGVVFGFFPALKAARLDPIEAFRHE